MRILVVGASGYVGGRLVTALWRRGADLRLAGRDQRLLQDRFPGMEVVRADLLEPASLRPALEGVDIAYYLAHSMGGGEAGFAERDLRAARSFASHAATPALRGSCTLGGLGNDRTNLSHHLASRHEVGAELARYGVPVTEFARRSSSAQEALRSRSCDT